MNTNKKSKNKREKGISVVMKAIMVICTINTLVLVVSFITMIVLKNEYSWIPLLLLIVNSIPISLGQIIEDSKNGNRRFIKK